MTTGLRWLILAASLGTGVACAQSNHCARPVTVETVGYGAPDERGARGTNAAVLEALAAAVVQVRGAFVQVETRLMQIFQEAVSDGERSITDSSSFARVIEERAAGLVVSYRILERSESGGLTTARVSVTVCTDPRLALHWNGAGAGRSAFEGALTRAFGTAGWHVVAGSAHDALDPLRASLASGATHFATVDVATRDAGAYRGVRAYNVDVAVQVRDLTGGVVLAGVQRTVNVAARSVAEAEALAATEVAAAIATDLLGAVAGTAPPHGSLVVLGTRRPNTPVEIQRLIEELPGVVSVEWQDRGDPLRFLVATTRGMCDVARDLADQRRLLVAVETCDERAATVRVLRE